MAADTVSAKMAADTTSAKMAADTGSAQDGACCGDSFPTQIIPPCGNAGSSAAVVAACTTECFKG